MLKTTLAVAAACAALATPALHAQTASEKEVLRAQISQALLPLIGDNSGATVNRLLSVKVEGAISKNFDLAKARTAAFGRRTPIAASDCRTTTTAAKEPDTEPCVYELGDAGDESGAYTKLSFSKNIGLGNVKFARRAAFTKGDETPPTPVRLSDADAFKKAVEFAVLLGVPPSEIPVAPEGATNRFPVRTLAIGAGDPDKQIKSRIELFKVVSLPRAFVVPGGLYVDPQTKNMLSHAVAPGGATIMMNDAGVQFARIDGWSDAQIDPKLDVKLAKSRAQLVNEITDDLYNEGIHKAASLSILIGFRTGYPNPDDPNPVNCPVCGVLRPALKVYVSDVGKERFASSEKAFVAPGLLREYDLVDQTEIERAAR